MAVKIKNKDIKLGPVGMIFLGVFMRLIPHPPNLAPISAMALFGGSYLPKRYAFILPLSALFLSDLVLGFYGKTMLFVYGSFLLIGFLGLQLRRNKKPLKIIGVSLFSSLIFYLITNFGVWAVTGMYAKTLAGLMESYIMALPFFRNTFVGDLLYTGLFFGAYELVRCQAEQFLPQRLYRFVFD